MTFGQPAADSPVDQGDLIDRCPVVRLSTYSSANPDAAQFDLAHHRVIVLTQTCDIAHNKADEVVAASVFDAQSLVDQKLLKPTDIRGPLRSGRVWGWYFLPTDDALGLGEMLVDLRRLHNVRLDLLGELCRSGHRRARLLTPYREHLAKHFADTYCRIGLPEPYETR